MAVQNVGVLFAKGLRKPIAKSFNEEPDKLKSVYNNATSDAAYEEFTAKVGPGVADVKPVGEEFVEKNIIIKTPTRVVHVTYGGQVRVPWEHIEDEQYAVLRGNAMDLGRSLKERIAIERALMFNLGFTTAYAVGYDALALFSASHTLDLPRYAHATTDITSAPVKGTFTWSNLLATASDFDYVSYIDALVLLRRTPGWEGDPMELEPAYLLGAPENEYAFKEVTKSQTRPDTANRADSAVADIGVQVVTTARLLDTDAWFLGARTHGLMWFDRTGLITRVNEDPNTWDALSQGAVRISSGFQNPRGWVGTPGA